ncbi:MerR family transcriptional regulator [Paenibacillus pinistramenti]|uniref:MerR family transcriptional regulator n=1 Tax=Paenibacillus pinistramenti TaxID=1768003 RepID=UPI00110937C1|nr:MerR family transcriptional regulator [Paenibacillus pinistramenti]
MTGSGSFKDKKVIAIGTVCELTGLSARKIRYYEERGLIFPERSSTGNRKYSFADVEVLMEIANQLEDGTKTTEIKNELKRKRMSDYMTHNRTGNRNFL